MYTVVFSGIGGSCLELPLHVCVCILERERERKDAADKVKIHNSYLGSLSEGHHGNFFIFFCIKKQTNKTKQLRMSEITPKKERKKERKRVCAVQGTSVEKTGNKSKERKGAGKTGRCPSGNRLASGSLNVQARLNLQRHPSSTWRVLQTCCGRHGFSCQRRPSR